MNQIDMYVDVMWSSYNDCGPTDPVHCEQQHGERRLVMTGWDARTVSGMVRRSKSLTRLRMEFEVVRGSRRGLRRLSRRQSWLEEVEERL